mmetsp:Transcript_45219/g.89762  ORF Transcript_45219/g.89762 Transcript_45219/m.89762 type:complete len:93 (+) Transcript_45219:961-1239(+)
MQQCSSDSCGAPRLASNASGVGQHRGSHAFFNVIFAKWFVVTPDRFPQKRIFAQSEVRQRIDCIKHPISVGWQESIAIRVAFARRFCKVELS